MVDRTNLQHVNQLYYELQQIRQAITNFDNGGHIASMIIIGADDSIPSAIIPTRDWDYPTQMVTQIKALLNARVQEIVNELDELGLTGVDA